MKPDGRTGAVDDDVLVGLIDEIAIAEVAVVEVNDGGGLLVTVELEDAAADDNLAGLLDI